MGRFSVRRDMRRNQWEDVTAKLDGCLGGDGTTMLWKDGQLKQVGLCP
jgi:hypothetical protein